VELPWSATLAWWGTAWLRGRVVTDEVLDVLGPHHAARGLPEDPGPRPLLEVAVSLGRLLQREDPVDDRLRPAARHELSGPDLGPDAVPGPPAVSGHGHVRAAALREDHALDSGGVF
jgi:hypothetical protein